MLKCLIAVILTCVLLWSGAALAEIEFDISVFENDPNYEVEFDEMDDTGKMCIRDSALITYSNFSASNPFSSLRGIRLRCFALLYAP